MGWNGKGQVDMCSLKFEPSLAPRVTLRRKEVTIFNFGMWTILNWVSVMQRLRNNKHNCPKKRKIALTEGEQTIWNVTTEWTRCSSMPQLPCSGIEGWRFSETFPPRYNSRSWPKLSRKMRCVWVRHLPWTSYQIRQIAGSACAGSAGNVFPANDFKING